MTKPTRGAFVVLAAAGLTLGAVATASAGTGSTETGSAGLPNVTCMINTILMHGTLSAGEAGFYVPGCGWMV